MTMDRGKLLAWSIDSNGLECLGALTLKTFLEVAVRNLKVDKISNTNPRPTT